MEKSRALRFAGKFAVLFVACAAFAQQYHPLTHRQYADVSGGPGWLGRPERDSEERPEEALDAIGIEKGSTVADVGCGPGYLTARLAKRVGPGGTVYGEDIQPEMLTLLVKNMQAQGFRNVKPVLGSETDPKLPKESVDLIILVDVYHEFSEPQKMLRGMREALKPNGRLVLLEYRAEDPKVMIRELHKMTVAQTRAEIEPEGFRFEKSIEVLPQQHIIIYRK
jgi:ubiquinone/menaquinone biosynthesis C-methylase UbiE